MTENEEKNNEIVVKLNNLDYRYDVYQMINIFLSFRDIKFADKDFTYEIIIDEDKVSINSQYLSRQYILDKKLKLKEELKISLYKYFQEITGKNMPWGTLIGIRPSKRAMNMIIEGKSEEDIIRYFKEVTLTSEEKAKLCIDVARREMKYMNPSKDMVSIYIGMAFCPTRCLYCSFAANPIGKFKANIVQEYINALNKEIIEISKYVKEHNLKIHTVYFGGGTPTSVNDDQFNQVMKNIYEGFILNGDVYEFTVECGRPDSISSAKLNTMKKYSVSRISINPQSMNDETLKLIGRNHTAEDIIRVFNEARKLGFKDINMDMIIGLPGEKLKHVEKTLNYIKKLKPDSFTIHGLSVKRASRLYENIINNVKYEIAPQEELNKMFLATSMLAKEMNMYPYYMYRQKNMVGNMENIGYAHSDKESIYNIEMIEDKETIIALGADAVTKVVYIDDDKLERFANIKDVREYVNRIDEMIHKKIELLDTLYK